ncbi:MAG: hypothetical protein K9J17_03475 [Flavobacteriales bacterium]|nr:hypothetical protein [Flavobacteriales bacterium]
MKHLFTLFCLLFSASIFAQDDPKNDTMVKDSAVGSVLFRVSYAAQIPIGDYADRFGFTNNIGASIAYRTKSNWIFSLGGHYIFGTSVVGKDSLLASLITSSNIIIGKGGEQAYVDISQMGYMVNFQFGKIFPWVSPNPNSGFMFTVGGGFMEHWIRYKAQSNDVPQILGDYKKGYDRLTNGIIIQEFIGYNFQGSTRLLNFYGGLEFTQGFTGNRRSYDIPTRSVKNDKYLDILIGFRVGWMMPFYKRNQDKYYYY